MTAVVPKISEGSDSSSFSKDDFLNFMETATFLERAVDDIKELIQCRSDMFLQKKEKQQQILDYQTMKLESEKNEYINKSEALLKEIGALKSQLIQIENSYHNVKNKLKAENQKKKVLNDRTKHLQLDSKQKNEKFNKTAELYRTVINWYKDFLNITVKFDKENLNVITVTFKGCKKVFEPSLRLQLLDKNKYKILATHPSIGKENNKQEILQDQEIILFVNKFWKHLQELHLEK